MAAKPDIIVGANVDGYVATWSAAQKKYIGAAIVVPVAANPTGSIGLTAVNGSAATFMRSDAAPAISQSIAPTWTGIHTFTNKVVFNGTGNYLFGTGVDNGVDLVQVNGYVRANAFFTGGQLTAGGVTVNGEATVNTSNGFYPTTQVANLGTGGIGIGSTSGIFFASASQFWQTKDAGIVRSAANTLKITNASTGYGNLDVGSVTANGKVTITSGVGDGAAEFTLDHGAGNTWNFYRGIAGNNSSHITFGKTGNAAVSLAFFDNGRVAVAKNTDDGNTFQVAGTTSTTNLTMPTNGSCTLPLSVNFGGGGSVYAGGSQLGWAANLHYFGVNGAGSPVTITRIGSVGRLQVSGTCDISGNTQIGTTTDDGTRLRVYGSCAFGGVDATFASYKTVNISYANSVLLTVGNRVQIAGSGNNDVNFGIGTGGAIRFYNGSLSASTAIGMSDSGSDLVVTSAVSAKSYRMAVSAPAASSTVTVDNANSDVVEQTLSGAAVAISAPTSTPTTGYSARLTLLLAQPVGGSAGTTFTWNAAYVGSDDLPLPSGARSTTAGKIDGYTFLYCRSLAKWLYVGRVGGFN